MASRPRLEDRFVSPQVLSFLEGFHAESVHRIKEAVSRDAVVVIGMAGNSHVKNVRRALAEAGVEHRYIEIGGYLSKWRERLAIKLWSGWPTFPQVFVRGVLIGGENLTKAALADGSLKSSLVVAGAPATA
jgi:glutaredoxin-related protein